MSIDHFQVKKEHSIVYRKEDFSQKINYFVNESQLNPSLKVSLQKLKNRIIASVVEFVMDDGSLYKARV